MQTQTSNDSVDFDLEDEIIVRAEAVLSENGSVTDGIIKVTYEHFIFESTGALDIVIGRSGIQEKIEDLTDAQFMPEEQRLVIRTEHNLWSFTGRHVPNINEKLQDYLAELRDEPNEAEAYRSEYEYLDDQIDLYEDDTLIGEGRIKVTDSRILLVPISSEEAMVDAYGFDVNIDQIGEYWLNSIHSRLQIDVANRTFDLRGPTAPMVHQAVCELLGTDPVESLMLSSRETSNVYRAKLPRFFWSYKGELHISTHAVYFQPTGWLASRIDPDEHEVNWSEVASISYGGWPFKKLSVQGRATGFLARVKDIEARYEEVVKTAFLALSELDMVARRSLSLFTLDLWKKAIKWGKEDTIVFCDPVIRTDLPDRATCGAMVLTRTHVLFLPTGGPESLLSPLKLPISNVKRISSGTDVDDSIVFQGKTRRYRFRPASGRKFVTSFWSRCQAPTKVIEDSEMRSRYLPRLIGETRSVRLFNQGQLVDAQRPGHAVAHPDGWAVVLRLDKLEFFQRLLPISIEVGQVEGVYQFDTRTLRLAAVPGHLRNLDHEKYRMLIAELPQNARIYNQREALRRPLDNMRISAKHMGDERQGRRRRSRSFEAYVHDISVGGASLSSQFPLTENQTIRMKLRLEDAIITPEATVSRVMPGTSNLGRTYGIRFDNLSGQDENVIFQAVQVWQRADASSRFE